MAIVFHCACGKRMQAREEFAGRKLKCGQCGTVVVIPNAAKAEAPALPPPPVPPVRATTPETKTPVLLSSWSPGFGQKETPWDPAARESRVPYRMERRSMLVGLLN